MSLTKDLVESFQAIYVNKYGINIDYKDAEIELKELASIVRLTSQNKVGQNA